MQSYIVLYREFASAWLHFATPPLGFRCQADDADHAEEQCENAYPGCDVLWVVEGDSLEAALADYYGGMEDEST